jgi:hypothetical protein
VTPRKTLSRLAIASTAAAAIAAPTALAQPIDPPTAPSGAYMPDDVRTPDGVDQSRAPLRDRAVPPSWPANPKAIHTVQLTAADDGDGLDWQVPAIAAGGVALVLGGLGARRLRIRSTRMHPAA